GWRIPFLLSALLVLFGLWVRKQVDETPAFRKIKSERKEVKVPIVEIFKTQWPSVLKAIGAKLIETSTFHQTPPRRSENLRTHLRKHPNWIPQISGISVANVRSRVVWLHATPRHAPCRASCSRVAGLRPRAHHRGCPTGREEHIWLHAAARWRDTIDPRLA
ncbi:MAG TPA: hypothetical protein PLA44_11570, partial [Propionibacteriaceae bacterium]|nr:hypothetical protein [Propionibacteriaceae bacterium]